MGKLPTGWHLNAHLFIPNKRSVYSKIRADSYSITVVTIKIAKKESKLHKAFVTMMKETAKLGK